MWKYRKFCTTSASLFFNYVVANWRFWICCYVASKGVSEHFQSFCWLHAILLLVAYCNFSRKCVFHGIVRYIYVGVYRIVWHVKEYQNIPRVLLNWFHAYLCWQQHAVTSAASVFQYNCKLYVYGSIENGIDHVSSVLSTLWCHKLHERYGVWSFGHLRRCFALSSRMNGWPDGLLSHSRAWVSMALSLRYIFNCWAKPNCK